MKLDINCSCGNDEYIKLLSSENEYACARCGLITYYYPKDYIYDASENSDWQGNDYFVAFTGSEVILLDKDGNQIEQEPCVEPPKQKRKKTPLENYPCSHCGDNDWHYAWLTNRKKEKFSICMNCGYFMLEYSDGRREVMQKTPRTFSDYWEDISPYYILYDENLPCHDRLHIHDDGHINDPNDWEEGMGK